MTYPLRVLVAVHNRILREGIRALIETQHDLEAMDAVPEANDAVRLFAEKRPGLTLMDLDMRAGGGLDAIRRIREMDPASWIIALTTDEQGECCAHAVECGAATVLAKDQIGRLLLPLIRAREAEWKPRATGT